MKRVDLPGAYDAAFLTVHSAFLLIGEHHGQSASYCGRNTMQNDFACSSGHWSSWRHLQLACARTVRQLACVSTKKNMTYGKMNAFSRQRRGVWAKPAKILNGIVHPVTQTRALACPTMPPHTVIGCVIKVDPRSLAISVVRSQWDIPVGVPALATVLQFNHARIRLGLFLLGTRRGRQKTPHRHTSMPKACSV